LGTLAVDRADNLQCCDQNDVRFRDWVFQTCAHPCCSKALNVDVRFEGDSEFTNIEIPILHDFEGKEISFWVELHGQEKGIALGLKRTKVVVIKDEGSPSAQLVRDLKFISQLRCDDTDQVYTLFKW